MKVQNSVCLVEQNLSKRSAEMELKDVVCPECGRNIKIDVEKECNFCFQCGYKIITKRCIDSAPLDKIDLEEKLEEVSFYYQISKQRKEALNREKNPAFYLKGQDLLLDLSNMFENDYRIWWELSKPLDYLYAEEVNDINRIYYFNEKYFDKALDLANIKEKKELILKYEEYEQKKIEIEKKYNETLKKERKRKEEQEAAERKKREEQEAAEKRRIEEEKWRCEEKERRRREEEENLRKLEEEKKQKREQEIARQLEEDNRWLYQKILENNYSMLDDTYFKFETVGKKEYIGIFKKISNFLYLMSFSFDKSKRTLYREQSIVVQVGEQRQIIKLDRKPIKVKQSLSVESILIISSDGKGGLTIGGQELRKDIEYVMNVIRSAKKPLVSIDKIFN